MEEGGVHAQGCVKLQQPLIRSLPHLILLAGHYFFFCSFSFSFNLSKSTWSLVPSFEFFILAVGTRGPPDVALMGVGGGMQQEQAKEG